MIMLQNLKASGSSIADAVEMKSLMSIQIVVLFTHHRHHRSQVKRRLRRERKDNWQPDYF